MNIIEKLRKAMDEGAFSAQMAAATDDVVRMGWENMERGRRLGIAEALGALGCDVMAERLAYHDRKHRREVHPDGCCCSMLAAEYEREQQEAATGSAP